MKIQTETVQVEVPTECIVITLTKDEAIMLKKIHGRIHGPGSPLRDFSRTLYEYLSRIGVEYEEGYILGRSIMKLEA